MTRRGLAGVISWITRREMIACGRCGWQGRAQRSGGADRAGRRGGPGHSGRSRGTQARSGAEASTIADIDLTALDAALDRNHPRSGAAADDRVGVTLRSVP